MHKVSVVIPAYNSQSSIVRCLQSIVNQTFQLHEVIIVDDGSTDDTVAVIENFIINHQDLEFKVFQQRNSGPSTARNLGIEKSSGEFIAFLDADDQWLPEKIELQMNVFGNHKDEIVLVSCLCDHPLNITMEHDVTIVDLDRLLWGNLFSTPTVVVRKKFLSNLKFNINQKYSEDYGLWLRLAAIGRCVLLNKVLVKLDEKPIYGNKGLSAKLWSMQKGELINYRSLYKQKLINTKSWLFFSGFSLLKYLKREIKSASS